MITINTLTKNTISWILIFQFVTSILDNIKQTLWMKTEKYSSCQVGGAPASIPPLL